MALSPPGRYLFDTDVVSATLRRQPDVRVVRRLATIPAEAQFISAITVGELVLGAVRRGRRDLLDRINELFTIVHVLPFDVEAAYQYGELKALLERKGAPLDEPDLRIAAIALQHQLILVTGNERHFARVPNLIVENWLT